MHMDMNKSATCLWSIKDIQLGIFESTSKGQLFDTKIMKIYNDKFVFDVKLYPNGTPNGNDHKYVQFCIILTEMSANIQSIVVHYRLYCIEMDVQFKDTKTLRKANQGMKWPSRSLKLKDIEHCVAKSLHFVCELCIIQMKEKKNNYYFAPFAMNNNIKYKWNIDDTLLRRFKRTRYGRSYCSDTFNNCWCLDCFPNGFNKHEKGNLRLSLVLLGLPENVQSIKIRFMLECSYNNISFRDDFEYNYQQTVHGWTCGKFKTDWLQSVNELYFVVTIAVIKVTNYSKKNISDAHWLDYGIVFNTFYDSNEGKDNTLSHALCDDVKWNIAMNDEAFYSCAPHTLYSRQMCKRLKHKMNGMELLVGLYPNGCKGALGQLQTVITVRHIPWHIDSVQVKYEVYCVQSLAQYKDVCVLSSRKQAQTFAIGKLSKYKYKPKTMEIGCSIEILSIKYNAYCASDKIQLLSHNRDLDYYKPLTIHAKNKFEWNIGGVLLDKCKKDSCCDSDAVYNSKDIDAHWVLCLFPNGSDANVMLKLQLIRLPPRVGVIKVYIVLHTNYGDITKKFTVSSSYTRNQMIDVMDFPSRWLYSMDDILSFTVWIEMKEVYDVSGQIINRTEWTKYGIIDNGYDYADTYDTIL
eukprot:639820_1